MTLYFVLWSNLLNISFACYVVVSVVSYKQLFIVREPFCCRADICVSVSLNRCLVFLWSFMCTLCLTKNSADADKPARRHVIYIIGSDDVRLIYCVFSIFKISAVGHVGFSYFRTFVKNSNLRLYLRRHAKFGKDQTTRGQVIAYFRFSKLRPSAIMDLVWRHSGPPTTCVWWFWHPPKIARLSC